VSVPEWLRMHRDRTHDMPHLHFHSATHRLKSHATDPQHIPARKELGKAQHVEQSCRSDRPHVYHRGIPGLQPGIAVASPLAGRRHHRSQHHTVSMPVDDRERDGIRPDYGEMAPTKLTMIGSSTMSLRSGTFTVTLDLPAVLWLVRYGIESGIPSCRRVGGAERSTHALGAGEPGRAEHAVPLPLSVRRGRLWRRAGACCSEDERRRYPREGSGHQDSV
jgi:hypothetical protein